MRRAAPRWEWARRGYSLLAVALPGSVRREFGVELLDTFDEELRTALQSDGRRGGLRFAVKAAIDVLKTGVRERVRKRRGARTFWAGSPPDPPGRFLVGLWHDMRSALRHFRRRPGLSLTVVLILALGLSSSVAVFTYVNAFVQTPPGTKTAGLVQAFAVDDTSSSQAVSYLDFTDYERMTTGSFQALAAVRSSSAASVRHEAMAEVVFLEAVSGGYFEVFGVTAEIGRTLQPEDDRPGAPPAVVISDRWWRNAFGGDPGVLGQTVFLNGLPHTLAGVLPPEFLGSLASFRPDVWMPFDAFFTRYTNWKAQATIRERPLVRMYGRLRAGVRADAAASELDAAAANLDAAYPAEQKRRLRLSDATWIDPGTRAAEAQTIDVMSLAALALVLLASANVANLLLAGMSGRRQEFATRAALGASGGRLFRQILAEHLLLSGAAGAVAAVLAGPLGTRLGSYFARPSVWGGDIAREVVVDPMVWGFAVVLSLIIGLLTGGWPAWRASREHFSSIMTRAPRAGSTRWGRRLPDARSTLVVVQVSMAVVLLVVALLVVRTLGAAARLDPGFDYRPLVSATVSISSTTIPAEERGAFYRDLSDRLTLEPWVRSATVSDTAPLSGHARVPLRVAGRNEPEPTVITRILPHYFETLGLSMTEGRNVAVTDTSAAPGVAVVSEALAKRYFPEGNAVGRLLRWPMGEDDREVRIVGIVADARVTSFLAPAEPVVYVPAPQYPHSTTGALLVSTTIDPAASVPILERWLRERESHIAIVNVQPYTEVVRGFLYVQRMNAELFSVLATVGLALATIGVFSVVALMVGQRTREIGIRMAIGAQAGGIRRMILGQASIPIGLGVVVGGLAALLASRLMRTLLLGVEPTDPASTVGGITLVMLTALLAAYVPARRAAQVDPIEALRQD